MCYEEGLTKSGHLCSCLEAVQKGTLKHPFIQEIDQNLGSKKITFIWVPGHVSIPGNEAADVAAKRGRTKRLLKKGTPKEDIKKRLKKLVHLKFDNDWNRQSEENQLRKIKTNTIRWIGSIEWSKRVSLDVAQGTVGLQKNMFSTRNQSQFAAFVKKKLALNIFWLSARN